VKIEDKKKLAVFMGWKTDDENPLHFWVWHESYKETVSTYKIKEWNPDTNPAQFKEVLERLTPEQKLGLDLEIRGQMPVYALIDQGTVFDDYLWISNHMPQVIQAILEVIEGDKK